MCSRRKRLKLWGHRKEEVGCRVEWATDGAMAAAPQTPPPKLSLTPPSFVWPSEVAPPTTINEKRRERNHSFIGGPSPCATPTASTVPVGRMMALPAPAIPS
ncbi:unnamed protein product [Musa hybrid cultivar]